MMVKAFELRDGTAWAAMNKNREAHENFAI